MDRQNKKIKNASVNVIGWNYQSALFVKNIAIIIIVVIFFSGVIPMLSTYSNLLNFIKKDIPYENLSVDQLITESIKIRYIGGNRNNLEKIFTSDFIKQIESMPYFYERKVFYYIDKSFINNIDLDQDKLSIEVRVGNLSEEYFQVVTLVKNAEGNFLISNIEIDI